MSDKKEIHPATLPEFGAKAPDNRFTLPELPPHIAGDSPYVPSPEVLATKESIKNEQHSEQSYESSPEEDAFYASNSRGSEEVDKLDGGSGTVSSSFVPPVSTNPYLDGFQTKARGITSIGGQPVKEPKNNVSSGGENRIGSGRPKGSRNRAQKRKEATLPLGSGGLDGSAPQLNRVLITGIPSTEVLAGIIEYNIVQLQGLDEVPTTVKLNFTVNSVFFDEKDIDTESKAKWDLEVYIRDFGKETQVFVFRLQGNGYFTLGKSSGVQNMTLSIKRAISSYYLVDGDPLFLSSDWFYSPEPLNIVLKDGEEFSTIGLGS